VDRDEQVEKYGRAFACMVRIGERVKLRNDEKASWRKREIRKKGVNHPNKSPERTERAK